MGKVISVQVGRPRQVNWKGDMVTTSIFKDPVEDRRRVSSLNIEGDEQSDLRVHGGPYKAVYAYPSEHYSFWKDQLGEELPWGSFGENLTIEGWMENEVNVGDEFQIGSTRMQVSQPRFPCFKLGIKFNDPGIIRQFTQAKRNGFYLRVLEEGNLQAGDEMARVNSSTQGVSISDFINLFLQKDSSVELIEKAINSPGIPPDWIEHFENQK